MCQFSSRHFQALQFSDDWIEPSCKCDAYRINSHPIAIFQADHNPHARGAARRGETILHVGLSQPIHRPVAFLTSGKADQASRIGLYRVKDYAVFRIAPSGTTPLRQKFHRAISSLRASATIIVFLILPF
jgi:hypothetical protein